METPGKGPRERAAVLCLPPMLARARWGGNLEAETLPHLSAAGGGLGEHKWRGSQKGDREGKKEKKKKEQEKKKEKRNPAGRKRQAGGDPKLRI